MIEYGFSAGATIRTALQRSRDLLFFKKEEDWCGPFSVIADFGDKSLYDCSEESFRQVTMKYYGGEGEIAERSIEDCIRTEELQWKHLEGLPCLLLLVEKGRMGDTFPQSFNCLDMRPRDVENYNAATIVQELGRLCRYCKFQDKDAVRFESRDIDAAIKEVDDRMKDKFSFDEDHGAIDQANPKRIAGLDMLAIFTERKKFVGYFSHLRPWEGNLPDADCVFSFKLQHDVATHTGTRKQTDTDTVVEITLPDGLIGPRKLISLQSLLHCRVIFFKDKKINETDLRDDDIYFTVESLDEENNVLKLKQGQRSFTTIEKGSICAVLRDNSCLQTHLQTILDEAPDKGHSRLTFLVKRISYDLPYALVTEELYKHMKKGVNTADVYSREISECIACSTLDRYVKLTDENRNKKKLQDRINRKSNPLHDYRRSYRASTDGTVSADSKNDPKNKHCHRFLISAECQIGKTGAYCHFLNRLREEIFEDDEPPHDEVVKIEEKDTSKWFLPFWRDISFSGEACTSKGWSKRRSGDDPTLRIAVGKYHPKVRHPATQIRCL